MSEPFIHLHVHSEFSLEDSVVRIKPLIKACAKRGMPAVALTDVSNLFAVVKFYRAAVAAGIKPIIGADVWLENPEDRNKPYRLVLLCQDAEGYRNLSHLISRAYLEGQHGNRPCIDRAWLGERAAGLIALSGAQAGDIGQALIAGNVEAAEHLLETWRKLFPGRFYLELQRTGKAHEDDHVHAAVALATRTATPVVATNNVRFLDTTDFDVHEVRVCIQDGRVLNDPRRPRRYTPQQYLRTPEEMAELFADIPEAIENTVEIARRCNAELGFGTYYLPDYPVPEGKTINDVLREQSSAGLDQRIEMLEAVGKHIDHEAYRARLNLELDVIIDMGFPGYFLIVADFIQWAKHNDVPVGPGRGSGAGSLVAYALGITDLDPIEYELLFERFLNPERVSMPDFDVDFCMDKRDRVIEYVAERYGREKVSQIITYGTMAARAVVRDVGRVLDQSYGYVDKLAKLIPFEIGMTLEKALEIEPQLKERYDNEEDVKELIDIAMSLEGLARNAGKHAGGVVIAPTALSDFMPIYCESGGGSIVSQLDKDDLEAIGLVKFDFLGLRNLTIIDKAVKIINAGRQQSGEAALVIENIPIDDRATYQLIMEGKTTALFQLESRGMKDLILRLKPDNFEEIVALVALFRPGPLQSGMVDDYIERKRDERRGGQATFKYPHKSLEPILKPTYGIILYQEQVMQIAQVFSGYTLGGADLLRRAMGKKKPEEMAKQREGFVKGAVERWSDVNEKQAAGLFDLIEKFAGYGFNRSHSAAYALIAYQTAWLKAHYPAAFMAAVLSSDMDNTDKVVTMLAECRDMGLVVKEPDINRCGYEFVPVDDATILYGIGAIKGIGESAIESIMTARTEGGEFKSLFDLTARIDLKRVNKRVLESLIRAGACDGLGAHRASLMASLPKALQAAGQMLKDREAGQDDLFGETVEIAAPVADYVEVGEWSEEVRLDHEKSTLGLYLTGHPIARFEAELRKITGATLADLDGSRDRAIVAGLVVAIRTMQTRRGDRMAFVTLDDRTGRLELAVFADLFAQNREKIAKDTLVIVDGQLSVDEYSGGFKMRADKIYTLDEARTNFAAGLVIDLAHVRIANGFIGEMRSVLESAAGGVCPVWVRYENAEAHVDLVLSDQWAVNLSGAMIERLEDLAGAHAVHIDYA